jgi:serine/threonine-protein kinase
MASRRKSVRPPPPRAGGRDAPGVHGAGRGESDAGPPGPQAPPRRREARVPAPAAPRLEDPLGLRGELLDARYRIIAPIGIGGMAVVYEAHHELIARPVAVKVILPKYALSDEVKERIFREARSANRVRHPGVVEVLDLGCTPEGLPFLVMELVQGESFERRLDRGPPALPDLLEIARQTCEALAAAHDVGVVHRDVTPGNILLLDRVPVRHGRYAVKVVDFGIAFVKTEYRLTHPGQVIGTPYYLAPEILLGNEVSPATDIYSLGAVLYEAIAGSPPFVGPGLGDIVRMHVEDPPPPIAGAHPDLPEGLAELVMKCLEKDPARRPRDMRWIVDRIAAVERGMGRTSAAARGGALGEVGADREEPEVDAAEDGTASFRVPLFEVAAWKEHLDRARARAKELGTADAALRLAEMEMAIGWLEETEGEAEALGRRVADVEARLTSVRERFAGALDALVAEDQRLSDRRSASSAVVEAAKRRRVEVEVEWRPFRMAVLRAEGEAAGAAGSEDVRPAPATPALVAAWRAAGETAARCAAAFAAERDARAALDACVEELADVRFQIERLRDNADRTTAPQSEEADRLRRKVAALESRRGDLYRKLIGAAAALGV